MAQRHSGKEWPKALLAAMLSSPGGITVVRAVKSVTIASTGPMNRVIAANRGLASSAMPRGVCAIAE